MQRHVDKSVPSGEMRRSLATAQWRQGDGGKTNVEFKARAGGHPWVNKSIESRNLSWQYLCMLKRIYTTLRFGWANVLDVPNAVMLSVIQMIHEFLHIYFDQRYWKCYSCIITKGILNSAMIWKRGSPRKMTLTEMWNSYWELVE